MNTAPAHIKVCHFASVHTIVDTRVFYRECVSLAKYFEVTYIGIGNYSGVRSGVKIIGIRSPKTRIQRLTRTVFRVFYLAVKEDADIYHFHDAELIPFGIILRMLGKKVIYDVHENTYADIMNKAWIPSHIQFMAGKGYRLLEWLASFFMPFILVIARETFAERFRVKKYEVVQNYADVQELEPFRVEDRPALEGYHLFYIGTLYDSYYNFSKLIEAIGLLKKQGLIVHLHCVGYMGRLAEQGLKTDQHYSSVREQITFHGHIVHPEGFEISRICKIGICLKNQPESILVSHERKFFEYMAIGLPVISCNSHIYKEVIDAYQIGRYTDFENAEAIAAVLKEMLLNEEQLREMSRNCIKAAEENFNWKSQEKLLVDMYRQLA